jgi:hypothetical protein
MIIVVCLCAVTQISAENPDNITLTSDEIQQELSMEDIQSADDVLSDYGDREYQSFDVIQQKINKAKSGDTIKLSGYYKGTGDEITIDKSLTIDGGEDYAYLTADGQSRIFYVSASNVVLKNLVMRDGDAGSYDGGAVHCSASKNTRVENCIFGFCEADYGGATYYCDVYDSAFLANSATRGGAMYGGNVYQTGFANNTASDRGGAMYVRDGVTVDHCDFENNTAKYGGALYSCASYNTVSYSNFKNNYASDDGGAIYNNDESNSGLTVLTCDLRFNEAYDDGGAIFTSSGADTVVENCYFWENQAGYWGGAMCRGSAYNSSFYLNDADKNGGGMYGGAAYGCSFSLNSPQSTYSTDVYRIITPKITLSQSGSYYGGKTVSAKAVDTNNNNAALSDVKVLFKFSNGQSATVYTGSNGVATYNVPFNPGTYTVTATLPSFSEAAAVSLRNIKIEKAPAKISMSKLSTKFGVNKYFKVKVINTKTNKGISGVKVILKVYTGKKAKKVTITTDSSGTAYYSPSKLSVGSHNVKASVSSNAVTAKQMSSKITVKKASTAFNTYNGLYYYKDVGKGKYYIGFYNKDASSYIKGIKIKVKVFTGKKSKTYTLKTDKDGNAILKTKGLSVGKHKVQITFKGNKNYKKSTAKATIEVSKKIPTRVGYYYMLTTHFNYGGSSRSVSAYLKDMNGNDINNKKITITGSNGGTSTGYSGSMISLPSGSTVVLRFAGDSKYMPSTFTIYFR